MLPIKGIPVQRPLRKKLAASTSHCLTIANATSLSTMLQLIVLIISSLRTILTSLPPGNLYVSVILFLL